MACASPKSGPQDDWKRPSIRSNPSKTSSVLARGRGTTLSFSLENMETVSAIAEIIRYKQPTLEQEEIDSTARSCTSAYCRLRCTRKWTEELLSKDLDKDFRKATQDGTLLCEVVNKMWPGVLKTIHTCDDPFFQIENIQQAQTVIRKKIFESELKDIISPWDVWGTFKLTPLLDVFHSVLMQKADCTCVSIVGSTVSESCEDLQLVLESYLSKDQKEDFERAKEGFEKDMESFEAKISVGRMTRKLSQAAQPQNTPERPRKIEKCDLTSSKTSPLAPVVSPRAPNKTRKKILASGGPGFWSTKKKNKTTQSTTSLF